MKSENIMSYLNWSNLHKSTHTICYNLFKKKKERKNRGRFLVFFFLYHVHIRTILTLLASSVDSVFRNCVHNNQMQMIQLQNFPDFFCLKKKIFLGNLIPSSFCSGFNFFALTHWTIYFVDCILSQYVMWICFKKKTENVIKWTRKNMQSICVQPISIIPNATHPENALIKLIKMWQYSQYMSL